jgi:hypothetical protein
MHLLIMMMIMMMMMMMMMMMATVPIIRNFRPLFSLDVL